MNRLNVSRNFVLAAGIIAATSATALGDALPAPAAISALPQSHLTIDQAVEKVSNSETDSNEVWKRRWVVSLAPLAASQALDAHSSWGHRELNPLLADANGGFGMKATGIKVGTLAGVVGVEYLLVRKYPRTAKFLSIVNLASAGVTSSFAIHNYNLK